MIYSALGLGVIATTIWAFQPRPIPVDMAQVSRGDLQVTLQAEGKTRVRDRYIIAADLAGHLDRIVLEEGDTVQVGSVVAQIDPLPANASVQAALSQLAEWRAERAGVATQRPKTETIDQARTRIQAAEARYQQAAAQVAQAQADWEQAQRDQARSRQLESQGAISRNTREISELNAINKAKDLEAAKLAAQATASEVEVAKAALIVVQKEQADPDYLLRVYDARIASAEAELAKLQKDAQRTVVRSPIAGKVLRIRQKSSQYVTEGTPLIEIANLKQLELVIDVLSTDAVKLKPGTPILIAQSSGNPAIRAKVRLIEPSAFTKVSALGVEEQRVNVIGDFLDSGDRFGDAYRVDVSFIVWQGQQVLQVPVSALFRCQETAWCTFVVQDGVVQQRSITIGQRSESAAEVCQGLTEGNTVITHPTGQIKAGVRVTRSS
ncbi:MAG: efflux transporter periplasmic adaptor subunit [Alkalinema sp. CACIAM 70d]|nr:MAG: efflux transporter periplasmic adaptor subunit [Alkalinema sp. CACIAM 70d]